MSAAGPTGFRQTPLRFGTIGVVTFALGASWQFARPSALKILDAEPSATLVELAKRHVDESSSVCRTISCAERSLNASTESTGGNSKCKRHSLWHKRITHDQCTAVGHGCWTTAHHKLKRCAVRDDPIFCAT